MVLREDALTFSSPSLPNVYRHQDRTVEYLSTILIITIVNTNTATEKMIVLEDVKPPSLSSPS